MATDLTGSLTPVSDLTIDIIHAEILPKLPLKSLMRFKTVSKSFNAIISSPHFARLHFNHYHHSSSGDTRLLVTNGTKRTIDIYDLDSESSAIPITTFRWYSFITSVVGSCNGLILIRIHRNLQRVLPLILLNPFTRAYIEFRSTDVSGVEGNVGLGFDEHSNDYKIVVVSGMSSSRHYDGERVTRVYSVNSKSWRVVDRTSTTDSIENPFTTYNGVLVNNHLLHWKFEKRSDVEHSIWFNEEERKECIISCFDVISETWQQDVLFPDFYYNPRRKGNNNVLDFGVLDGCLFSSFVNKVESLFDVWVMKEYGVQESWMKLLSINIGVPQSSWMKKSGVPRSWIKFWRSNVRNDPYGGVVPIAEPFTGWTMVRPSCMMSGLWGPSRSMVTVPGGLIPVACRGPGQTEVLLMSRQSHRESDDDTLFWYNWKRNAIMEPQIPNFYGHQPFFVEKSLVSIPDAELFGELYEHA